MKQPRIKIQPTSFDYLLEVTGLFLIVIMIGLPVYYYNVLPETIPIHFNALGQPDDYSQKNFIWILPAIGLVLYIALTAINFYPHIFNYPVKITEENAFRQYRMATRLIRIVKCITAAIFCYISFATIQTALNERIGLSTYFMPVILVALFSILSIYLYRAVKTKPSTT